MTQNELASPARYLQALNHIEEKYKQIPNENQQQQVSVPGQSYSAQEHLEMRHVQVMLFAYKPNPFFELGLPLKMTEATVTSIFTTSPSDPFLLDARTRERFSMMALKQNGNYELIVGRELRIRVKNRLSDSLVRVVVLYQGLDSKYQCIYPFFKPKINSLADFRALTAGEETVLVIPTEKLPTLENFAPEQLETSTQNFVRMIVVFTTSDNYQEILASLQRRMYAMLKSEPDNNLDKVAIFHYKFDVRKDT